MSDNYWDDAVTVRQEPAPNDAPPRAQSAPSKDDPWADAVSVGSTGQVKSRSFLQDPIGVTTNFVSDAARATVDAVTGGGRYKQGVPELGTSGEDVSAFSEQGVKMLGAYALSGDSKAVADIAVKILPGAERKNDEYGNEMISWRGQDYYINRPGISEADLFKFASDVAAFGPATKMATGVSSLVGRTAAAFPLFAGTSVGQDVAARQLGSEQDVDLPRAAIAGGSGAAGELLGPVVQKAWRAIVGNKAYFNPATGTLTERGAAAARSAGLDPNNLPADVAASFATRFAKTSDAYGPGPRAANEAASDVATEEFGIPYTQGQRTGDIGALQAEEATRQGVRGNAAADAVRNFDEGQTESVVSAARGIQDEISANGRAPSMNEAATTVQQGAQRARDAASRGVDDAYAQINKQFADNPPRLTGESVRGIRETAVRTLRDPEMGLFGIDRQTAPLTMQTLRELRIPAVNSGRIKAVTLESIEALRRRINTRLGATDNKADKRGLMILKRSVDQWLDGAIDNAMISGDPAALALLKDARRARYEYGKRFELLNPRDDAGKFVQKLLDESTTPEEIARGAFGATTAYPQAAARIAGRLKSVLGEDSAEFAAFREMGWMRIVRSAVDEGVDGKGASFSPRKFVTALSKAINENDSLMKELFTADQLAKFKRFGVEVARLVPPDKFVGNSSRTAWEMIANARQFGINLISGGAALKGGPVAGAATRVGLGAADSLLTSRAARRSINPRLDAPRNIGVPAISGAAAVQQGQE